MGASDWIGMFSVASGARVDFKFTSCANSLSPTPIQAGACTFVLPSPPGQYRFRLFSDGRWIELAISQPVTSAVNTMFGPTVKARYPAGGGPGWVVVTWSGAASGLDWVGLFRQSDGQRTDFKFVSCQERTGGLPFGNCDLAADGPGTYEARLCGNNTWYQLAVSGLVAVEDVTSTH
jgi:hypothetical protein